MSLFDTLPDRPLKRSEVDQLEAAGSVQGVFPVYGQIEPNTAHGIVILMNGTLRAWAYDDEWIEIDEREIDDPAGGVGGIPFSETDTLEELQDAIAERIGAVGV